MIKIFKYMASVAFVAGGATAAAASDLPPQVADEVMNACRPDYHRVCSYVVPGEGRVARCLLDHERELAPYCLKAVKLAYALEVCLPDYRRLCGGAPLSARSVQCLADKIDSLAPACQRVVDANVPYIGTNDNRYGYNNREFGPHGGPYGYSRDPASQGERFAYNRNLGPRGDRFSYNREPVLPADPYGYNRDLGPQGDRFSYNREPVLPADPYSYNRDAGPRGDRFGYNPDLGPQGDRFSDNRAPSPYDAPDPKAYSFREAPRYGDGYGPERQGDDGAYDRRYAGRGYDNSRHQPYGDGAYPDRGYDEGNREPYSREDNREPLK